MEYIRLPHSSSETFLMKEIIALTDTKTILCELANVASHLRHTVITSFRLRL
jgi:hypothetical protein